MGGLFNLKCGWCGKLVVRYESEIRYHQSFCSKPCHHEFQRADREKRLNPLSDYLQKKIRSKVDIRDSGCWEWQGQRVERRKEGGRQFMNYGLVKIGTKTQVTHRVAWTAFKGAIPEGMNVLHKCDNPPCCNPDHLFLGTNADNVKDCSKKDRHSRGARSPKSKLTDKIVKEIRDAKLVPYDRERGASALARRIGVADSMIHEIRARKRWKHIN